MPQNSFCYVVCDLVMYYRVEWSGDSLPNAEVRLGLREDRPFLPLPFVDLPMGLTPEETEQFLREQRLEELNWRVRPHSSHDASV